MLMHGYSVINKRMVFAYICLSLLPLPVIFAGTLSQSRVDSDVAVEILFTANLNGSIENCNCGNPPLGGLDYMSTLIKERRARSYPVFYIDGGDYFNSYPYIELDQAALQILMILQPDGFLPAEQEFQEDEKLIKCLFDSTNILGSNFQYNDFAENGLLSKNLASDKKMILTGYLSPESFSGRIAEKLLFSDKKFRQVYDKLQKENILVVVFHGTKPALDRFIALYPGTDLILWAHEQSRDIELSAKPAIVGGGSDGEHLVIVNLSFGKKKELRIQVEKVPVSRKIPSDPAVKKIIEDFNRKIKQ